MAGQEQQKAEPGEVYRGKSFTMRVVKCCNIHPREVGDVPCLSEFRRHLDNALNEML